MAKAVVTNLIAYALGGILYGQSPANPFTFQEFTMIRAEISGTGTEAGFSRIVVDAHRIDGSSAQATLNRNGDPDPQAVRYVRLVPERTQTSVYDALHMKSTRYILGSPMVPRVDPKCGLSSISETVHAIYAGEDEILGIGTVKIRTEYEMNGVTEININWNAPDLDCATLRSVSDFRDKDGKLVNHFDMHASTITRGAPDARWFTVPDDYAEKSPSQIQAALWAEHRAPTGPVRDQMNRRLASEDQQYFANHQTAGK
jgi:hypothetical protein